MNDNKRKNSGSIATWLEKRSKTTIQDTRINMMNDPIPIAVSSVTLRRLKTWIRSEMGQSRLTGLALLHIHRQLPLNVDKIMDRFAKNKRCLDFVI
ncbi:unnamed protein product [Macrosiphum euphorbiae]|uniref:Uncharacterized protein n=1 Tax=Macrosiphum euphorbiae TaxID=13131 RepID=A0AAV0Y7V6_9HEMI|nr:unnamed protein product [Macrosiphum euphorbiae]